MSYILHMLLLAIEVAYLMSVICFIQLRHFFSADRLAQLQHKGYLTTVVSVFQCVAAWLLYVVATDSYRAVRVNSKPAKILELPLSRRYVCLVILGAILFHVPYLPPIRALLYQANPSGFNPCTVPMELHWDFTSTDQDLYHMLYYSLLYFLVVFLLPFLLVAARNKDTIDLLHDMTSETTISKPEVISACFTTKVICIFCNVALFCTSPKIILLLFQMVDYAVTFLNNAQVFFQFFNVLANLLLVVKSSVYLCIFILFHPKVKMIVCAACCYRCYLRKYRNNASNQKNVPIVIVTNEEI